MSADNGAELRPDLWLAMVFTVRTRYAFRATFQLI